MPWQTIRRANRDDIEKLEAAAQRFIERHRSQLRNLGFHHDEETASAAYDLDLIVLPEPDDPQWIRGTRTHIRKLWKAITRRTLDAPDADGIAYGFVGYHVD